jgi:hypothetical protein
VAPYSVEDIVKPQTNEVFCGTWVGGCYSEGDERISRFELEEDGPHLWVFEIFGVCKDAVVIADE